MKIREAVKLSYLELMLEKLQSGAYKKPGYDPEKKTPVGSVKDWLDAIGATPEDLKKAYQEAKSLPSYKKIADQFKPAVGGKASENGTFGFQDKDGGAYYVYANGVIRREGEPGPMLKMLQQRGYHNLRLPITRLKAPKPALVHGDAVKSLVKIYDNAFKELGSKKIKEQLETIDQLDEGYYGGGYRPRGVALLPATQVLWHKNKITIDETRSVWDDGMVQICKKNGSGSYVFLHGSGKADGYVKAGGTIPATHDQTMKPMGDLHVIAVVQKGKTKDDDKITSGDMSIEDAKKIKAPLWVYK